MSEFVQKSFSGGMNLLLDDTRLEPNQYRLGFNVRNRLDNLDAILESVEDTSLPAGLIQEVVTFGIYIITFVAGSAYYRIYNHFGWTKVNGFAMSPTAPRYWTIAVPLATTNYGRFGATVTIDSHVVVDARLTVKQVALTAAVNAGNVPGLLVQDNINQPQFIYLDQDQTIQVRVTQAYADWDVGYDLATGTMTHDEREYVPIGNDMAWDGVVLYITSQDTNILFQSVSGRPLDFVRNVAANGSKGGDATTTSYSVGVGGISCLRVMADGTLFVAAGNSNFIVYKDTSNSTPKLWDEYPLGRRFLFESTCLSDRCILDSMGDTKFIDLTGVRSFNAISQVQNEGRNTPFTATIQAAFNGIVQDVAAAILYDNYELYAMQTIFGPAIVVYDTIAGNWTGFDTRQTNLSKIKQFAKIELGVQRLVAITEDNKLYTLYSGTGYSASAVLTQSRTASQDSNDDQQSAVQSGKPGLEMKMNDFRVVLSKITASMAVSILPIIDSRVSKAIGTQEQLITYEPPAIAYTGNQLLPDINTMVSNRFFATPECEQGWKTAILLGWTGGASIVQFSMSSQDLTPNNPPLSQ